MDSKPFAAVSFAATANADPAVKEEAVELEQRHAPWLYQMPAETVSALLPFLSVPQEKTVGKEQPKETAAKEKPQKESAQKKKTSEKKTASQKKSSKKK